MKVVGIHPEDLLDKLTRGQLSDSERSHLEAHLRACPTCRLELELRADFEREAADIDVSQLPAPRLARTDPPPSLPRRGRPVRRVRGRWVWGFAVAGVVTATGAVAAVMTHRVPWLVLPWQPDPPETAAAPALTRTPSAPAHKSGRKGASPAIPERSPESPPEVPSPQEAQPPRLAVVSRSKLESPGTRAPGIDPAQSPSTLFAAANLARRRGSLGEATKLYHELQSKFPGSGEARLSWVTCARLDLDMGRAARALGSFDRYLRTGAGPLKAEALVGRASALRQLGRRSAEASAWRQVAREYPGSAYAQQAAERLAALDGRP